MKLARQGGQLTGSAEAAGRRRDPLAAVQAFVYKTLVIAGLDARKLRHDPTEVVTRAVQPVLWLLLFGTVMANYLAQRQQVDTTAYRSFLAPGILAQSVLFIAIFSGMSLIWERDLGIIHKFLASPTPRAALSLGKALSGGIRALPQCILVYILAALVGVSINWNPLALAGVLIAVITGAAAFSAFSLIIALLVKTRDRFMGIGQVLTMPFFFASNAIYPIDVMPDWLKVIAHINPLTYEVDALRTLMVKGGIGIFSLPIDFGVLLLVTIVMVYIAGRMYPRAVS